MQLISVNILTWFFVVFLIDLIFLYVLPMITFDNLRIFSWIYFLDPMHTLRLYLEVQLGMFSMSHMSRLMEKFVFMDAWIFLRSEERRVGKEWSLGLWREVAKQRCG